VLFLFPVTQSGSSRGLTTIVPWVDKYRIRSGSDRVKTTSSLRLQSPESYEQNKQNRFRGPGQWPRIRCFRGEPMRPGQRLPLELLPSQL
jgi:hypothetical protein